MNIYSKRGTKIVFIGENGYDHDKASAKEILKVGQEYTVQSIDVRSCISYVILEEFQNKTFNTVMFDEV